MAFNIPLFNTLKPNMYSVHFEPPISFKGKTQKETDVELIVEEINAGSNTFTVEANGGHRPDDYSLILKKDMALLNCNRMYGPEGLVPEDAVLGVALIWKSSDSKQRGAKHICDVKNQQEEQTWHIKHEFPRGALRGRVSISIVIYLKKKSCDTPLGQCDIDGTILGEIEQCHYLFDGNGAMFPIATVSENNNPLLWSVDCKWDDPEEDSFSESVLIKLNSSHESFDKINCGNEHFDKSMFVEIISAAMSVVLSVLRENHPTIWREMLSDGYSCSTDSVCYVLKYMIDTLELDLDDPIKTSVSFRKYFEEQIREMNSRK